MTKIYVIDWLINKPIQLEIKENDQTFSTWDKILYKTSDSPDEMVWTYLGYSCESMKKWEFIRKLKDAEEKLFFEKQQKAKDIFDKHFKKDFLKNFPESVPISARMDLKEKYIYFYFYAETRFDFKDFIKILRERVSMRFFLFQVWARDRIRFSERSYYEYWVCGHALCCKTGKCPLPTVDSDNIQIQNLENRWIEKLKWRCWKLKCCLNFEKNIYEDEWKKFPKKWDKFQYKKETHTCYWFNIMTWEIIAKNEDKDNVVKIKVDEIDQKN